MYNVSPDGADSSIKIDVTASKLGCLATPLRVVNRSDGAGGSPAEAIIRLLFGDICDRAGPFLKFEKTITLPPENCCSIAVRFHKLKPWFSVSVLKP